MENLVEATTSELVLDVYDVKKEEPEKDPNWVFCKICNVLVNLAFEDHHDHLEIDTDKQNLVTVTVENVSTELLFDSNIFESESLHQENENKKHDEYDPPPDRPIQNVQQCQPRKKSKKTSSDQYMLYVNFLKDNPQFRHNKKSACNPKYLKDMWIKLAALLNASAYGSRNTVQKWKSVLRSWRSETRRKARDIKEHANSAGSGKPTRKVLSEAELSYLSLVPTEVADNTPHSDVIAGFDEEAINDLEEEDIPVICVLPQETNEIEIDDNSVTAEVLQPSDHPSTNDILDEQPPTPVQTTRRVRKRKTEQTFVSEVASTYAEHSKNSQVMMTKISAALENVATGLSTVAHQQNLLMSAITKLVEVQTQLAELKKAKYTKQ